MTVIAVKDGIIAADSRTTIESDSGGIRMFKCEKLYRKVVKGQEVVIATAGEASPALVFVDWYGSGKEPPAILIEGEADFSALVCLSDGSLVEYDSWCRGEQVIPTGGCYAIGCGAKAAMGAMLAGASAQRAVEITCEIDPLCGPPVIAMPLPVQRPKRKRK